MRLGPEEGDTTSRCVEAGVAPLYNCHLDQSLKFVKEESRVSII